MSEEVATLSHSGFTYRCRVVRQPDPRMAPVVIIGGSFQNMRSWRRLEDAIGPLATVVTLDLPGSGSADFLAAAVEHAMDRCRIGMANVVGASYGALIAHRLAQRSPSRVGRMVLNGVIDRLEPAEAAALRDAVALYDAGRTRAFVDRVVSGMFCMDPALSVRRRESMRRVVSTLLSRAPEDEQRKFAENSRRMYTAPMILPGPVSEVPTAVFTGAHDTMTRPPSGARLAASYRHGRFFLVAEADHMVYLQRDREYAEIVLAHFTGRPPEELPYCAPYRLPVPA